MDHDGVTRVGDRISREDTPGDLKHPVIILRKGHLTELLKGQCPDYAHARASSVFSSKDNRTVILTRQDFLPDRTADRDLLFIFSSNILDFQRSLSSYIKIWLAVRRLIAILSLAGPPRDPKISFRSL